jgi:hypothetical protein
LIKSKGGKAKAKQKYLIPENPQRKILFFGPFSEGYDFTGSIKPVLFPLRG